MSRFFVGQRVRVVHVTSYDRQDLLGIEGHIIEARKFYCGTVAFGLDVAPITPIIEGGQRYWLAWHPDQLEPILPEGAQPSEFETLAELIDSLQVTA